MEWTVSKTREDMRAEIRKLQSEMTELKNLVGKTKDLAKKALPAE